MGGAEVKLFEALPKELFSVLASPNRELYADALDVLYAAYQEKLKIPEEMLYSMLRSKLEQQLAEIGTGRIVDGVGRGIALDRDRNYEKVKLAYDALVDGAGALY